MTLVEAAAFARAAERALPIDDEADRRVVRALQKRSKNHVPRKLSTRREP